MDKGPTKHFKIMLIALLVGITTFSIFKYALSLKEKYALLNTLNQMKEQVAALEVERQNLLQELDKEKELQQELIQKNTELKDYLRASKQRLTKLFTDYRGAQKAIEHLGSQFSILKVENTALIEQQKRISQENENLKAKLNSIIELKKAIKELKRQMRKVSIEIKQKTQDREKIVEGNHGYLIKDGQFTYPTRVKIEVIPASTKE